jgi:hypothetical protein
MKRSISTFLLALIVLSFSAAQAAIPSLRPNDARSMGLGGAFTATSWGWDSFYGNPAGFASPKAQLTIADLSAWAYLKPTTANIAKFEGIVGGSASNADLVSAVGDLIVDNGFGGGFSTGLGYTGKGIALGLYAVGDVAARGASALGAVAKGAASFNAVIGLGFPIQLGDAVLRLGADVRPFYRADSEEGGWLVSGIFSALLSGTDLATILMDQRVEAGFGLAMDFGAQLALGSLSIGLSVRDVTPSFLTKNEKVADFIAQLNSGAMPDFSSGSASELLLPEVSAGIAWRPRLIKGIFEPGLYLEVQDPVSVILDKASVWNLLHLGVDARLFTVLELRAGINKGWLSAGLGLNLWLVEINAAIFTKELGSHPGDEPMTGVSVQASFHI